jgi:hypothetical protein
MKMTKREIILRCDAATESRHEVDRDKSVEEHSVVAIDVCKRERGGYWRRGEWGGVINGMGFEVEDDEEDV